MKTDIQGLLADIRRLKDPFNLSRSGLGDQLLDIAVLNIVLNCSAGLDPDGQPWLPLSKSYQLWKDNIAPGQPIGRLFDLMLDYGQLSGERTVGPAWAIARYGTDSLARIEAMKFQEGGLVTGTNQPPRPFYGFTHGAVQMADATLTHVFNSFIT